MTAKAGRVRRGVLALGMVSAVVLTESPSAAAQVNEVPLLTVQPRTMATGTQNPAAGEYPLEWGSTTSRVFIPPECAGAKRCPLLVYLPPAQEPSTIIGWLGPVMRRYGMILLVAVYRDQTDAYLKETLQRFAIDPEKIAIVGHCGTASPALELGAKNLHVFSRIASMSSPANAPVAVDPQNKTAEFFLERGVLEEIVGFARDFNIASKLQQEGHPARQTVSIRDHGHQAESFEMLGRWLHESWTKPPAERTAPTVIEPLPLTTDAVARMATFWTSFFHLPDSAWTTDHRLPYIRNVVAQVGQMRALIPMTDMAALAAHYPSVAAALKKAGLTGQQHDAYRLALATAMTGVETPWPDGTIEVEPNSVLAKNISFVKDHPDELEAFAKAGLDLDPSSTYVLRNKVETTKTLGPLGTWLTP